MLKLIQDATGEEVTTGFRLVILKGANKGQHIFAGEFIEPTKEHPLGLIKFNIRESGTWQQLNSDVLGCTWQEKTKELNKQHDKTHLTETFGEYKDE